LIFWFFFIKEKEQEKKLKHWQMIKLNADLCSLREKSYPNIFLAFALKLDYYWDRWKSPGILIITSPATSIPL